jgi:hypothetical protein
MLAEYRAAFDARAGLVRPQLEARTSQTAGETDAAHLASELDRLRAWPG